MSSADRDTRPEAAWQTYLDTELPRIRELIGARGFSLDAAQPHVIGERFLMQAMTTAGGRKLILLGTETATGRRVVIKATRDSAGRAEILHERTCRSALHDIPFAYDVFQSPPELAYFTEADTTVIINAYIDQPCSFLERPLPEQFAYALRALTAQAAARATTHGHLRHIRRTFGRTTATEYLQFFTSFADTSANSAHCTDAVRARIAAAGERLSSAQTRIEQYGDFLTHTDFVPHNFRIGTDGLLYLLDFSSLRFGNKHEGWARFLNFMTLYNRDLEAALITYVEENRSPEERESLQLMRLYRLGEIIAYYVRATAQSTGTLQTLNRSRVDFWGDVLAAELENTRVPSATVAAYTARRDALRSEDEKRRQEGLH
jgi:hypothetical protein